MIRENQSIMSESALIAELEHTIAYGSDEKRLETLRQVTDLFMGRANLYSAEQIDLFDGVIGRLVSDIETKARAELARRIAPVSTAPIGVVRDLANDAAIEVAGPMLARSMRLSEKELVAAATSKSQAHLLAISQRSTISEAVTDVLVSRGDQNVVRSVAGNDGARLSDEGRGKLVKRAEQDDVLAVRVAKRHDIPAEEFHRMVNQASGVVLKKLTEASPHLAPQLRSILADISAKLEASRRPQRNYSSALRTVMGLQRSGKLGEVEVAGFTAAGRFEETIASLAALCRMPIEDVERAMLEISGDIALIIVKAIGLSWSTVRSVFLLCNPDRWSSQHQMEQAEYNFERLRTKTAQRVIRFHHARQSASKLLG